MKKKLDWYYVSRSISLPNSSEFFKKYENKLNWNGLSDNFRMTWTQELLEKYNNKLFWFEDGINCGSGLTESMESNSSIKWNIKLIQKFEDKWDYSWIRLNKNIYENVFKQFINDTLIEEIINS